MIYFLLFIIIIIYAYESWKGIKGYPRFLKEYIESFTASNNINNQTISEENDEEDDGYKKFGLIPHNVTDYSNNPIISPIQSLDTLKETDNREKAHYLIRLRLEELRRQIEVILDRLVETEMISVENFRILTTYNDRLIFLTRYRDEIPTQYMAILDKQKLLKFNIKEFRFLLRLMNRKELLTDRGYKYLANSNVINNLKVLNGLNNMRLKDGKLTNNEESDNIENIGSEDLENVLNAPGIYAMSYQSLPNEVDKLNFTKKQTDEYNKYREEIPIDWKCQSINIIRDGNKVIESEYDDCRTLIPKEQMAYHTSWYSSN